MFIVIVMRAGTSFIIIGERTTNVQNFRYTASTHRWGTHWWVRFFAAMLHEQSRDVPANLENLITLGIN